MLLRKENICWILNIEHYLFYLTAVIVNQYAKNVSLMQTTLQIERNSMKVLLWGRYTKQTRQPISSGTMFTKSRGIESTLR